MRGREVGGVRKHCNGKRTGDNLIFKSERKINLIALEVVFVEQTKKVIKEISSELY